MGSGQAVRTGILFSASHPKIGLYWNFLRIVWRIDDGAAREVDWTADTFAAVTAGRHEVVVVGKPITRVGPTRANAHLTVDVAVNEIVHVHYEGPVLAWAFLGRVPLFRARLTVTGRGPARSRRLPGVESSVQEFDRPG